jgi:hypothetical protein
MPSTKQASPAVLRVVRTKPEPGDPFVRITQLEKRVNAEREAAAAWKNLASDLAQALRFFTMGGVTRVRHQADSANGDPPRAIHFCRVPHTAIGRAVQLLNGVGDLARTEQHRNEREAAEDATSPTSKSPPARSRRPPTPVRADRARLIA